MRQNLGKRGETWLADQLETHGVQVIARNYRTRQGEIDLILSNQGLTIFVEVKTSKQLHLARERVSPAQANRIRRCACEFMSTQTMKGQPRFDTVFLSPAGDHFNCHWVRNAF